MGRRQKDGRVLYALQNVMYRKGIHEIMVMNLAVGLARWEGIASANDFPSGSLSKTCVCSEKVSWGKKPSAAVTCELSQVEE